MKDILRQIYAGELYPEEQRVPATEEYVKQQEKIRALESAFCEKLPLELKDAYIEMIEAYTRLTGIAVEEACVYGMRIGGKIASAFFLDPKELPKRLDDAP